MSQREPFRVRSSEKLLIKQAADMYSHTHEHSATAAIISLWCSIGRQPDIMELSANFKFKFAFL